MTNPDQEDYVNSYPHLSNMHSPHDLSHSYSVNTIPSVRDYLISEDILAGQRLNGMMSNIRQSFCFFVIFDFLFTSLMWIICIMLKGQYIVTALSQQVVHYNIHTSLFDIVLLAFCRLVVLILFYALLYLNHWIMIAISTAATSGFLITKVFFYDWPHSSQPVFEVLLVLVSFILTWGEAWFLDFRVIPQESNAHQYFITTDPERAPLVRNYVQGLPSLYTESVGNFYSPLASPEGSLLRYDQVYTPNQFQQVRFTREQEENYKTLAAKALQESWDIFQMKEWNLQKTHETDSIYMRELKGRKIFKLLAQLDISPKYLLEELFCRVQDFSKWNTNIKESYKIQTIDEYTDIVYQVSNDGMGGLVSSRDFINLRHWALIDDNYVICHVKTEHPSLPVNKKIVRAENNVGCTVILPTDDPNKCNFCWIISVDLKLSMPSFILDKEMANVMICFIRDLRQHIYKKTATI